jgi:hypothetical protein
MLRQFRQKRLLGGCGAYPSVRTLAAYSGSYWSSYLEICIRHYVRVWPKRIGGAYAEAFKVQRHLDETNVRLEERPVKELEDMKELDEQRIAELEAKVNR